MRFTSPLTILPIALVLSLNPTSGIAQQVADSAFAPPIARPAYAAGEGPVVLLDEGHVNFHTLDGRYYTFGRLLARDGYRVRPLRGTITADALDGARVLVIANALAPRNAQDWSLPTPSAFTSAEIGVIEGWVRGGGSLLLIADHMPFPGAAEQLAAAFGVEMHNGFAFDSTGRSSTMRFTRRDGLADHPITRGRDGAERVDSVVAFTGQAFRAPEDAEPLMTLPAGTVVLLPERAWQFTAETPRLPAGGMLQGAVLRHGAGRVAVFGEAAMFSAQLGGPQRQPMGMNAPTAPQNAQFLLNVMHWLTGEI